MVQNDAPKSRRRGLVPACRLDELVPEHRVLTVERICELERISHAKIADQDRSRDLATVDPLLEAGFPLQETNIRRLGAVEALTVAVNTHRMQFQLVVLGHKWDGNLACAAQRGCVIDQQRASNVDDGSAINVILSISQSEYDRVSLARLRDRNQLDPS